LFAGHPRQRTRESYGGFPATAKPLPPNGYFCNLRAAAADLIARSFDVPLNASNKG
jgi:hypothetical protein